MLTMEQEEKIKDMGKRMGMDFCLNRIAVTSGYMVVSSLNKFNAKDGVDEKLAKGMASMIICCYQLAAAMNMETQVEAQVQVVLAEMAQGKKAVR